MEYGQGLAWILMCPNLHFDIVIAVLILRDLKDHAIEPATVVIADSSLILFAKNIFYRCPDPVTFWGRCQDIQHMLDRSEFILTNEITKFARK